MHGMLLALASALLFGAATPASKLLLEHLAPFQLAGLLYLGAATAMLPSVFAERHRGHRFRADRANAARLLGAVALGGVVAPVLLLFALRLSGAGSVSLLLNLEMVATAALGAAFFREPLGRSGWLGVAGVATAAVLLAGGGGWPGLTSALLVAAACTAWGLDNHWTALIDGITPARSTLVKGAVAGAVNLAIGLAAAPLVAPAGNVAAALLLGALSYGVSIALYIAAAQQLGATRAQAVFASAPFVGAALGFGLLGETFGVRHMLASGLLLASVATLLRSRHEHLHVHEAVEHVHAHRHDDGHHHHEHTSLLPGTRHTHPHRHERQVHAHPHWPDLHHRHHHGGQESDP